MATRTAIPLEDDLDGGPAAETVRFSLGTADYEQDLSAKNAGLLPRSWRRSSIMPARPVVWTHRSAGSLVPILAVLP